MMNETDSGDSDPEAETTGVEGDQLAEQVCRGREIFHTTRDTSQRLCFSHERAHIFEAAIPHRSRIHPDWVGRMHPDMLSDHGRPLVGDEFTIRDPGRSDSRTWRPTSHVMVACQNVTWSCSPYNRAERPDDECRFATWVTLVNSGVLDVAFLVDAYCSVGDVRQCRKY